MINGRKINPSTFPGLKPGVCSGLILSGAFDPAQKDWVWRRRSIKKGVNYEENRMEMVGWAFLFVDEFPPHRIVCARDPCCELP